MFDAMQGKRSVFNKFVQEMDHSLLTEAIIQPTTTAPCAFNHVTKPAHLPLSTSPSALHQVIWYSLWLAKAFHKIEHSHVVQLTQNEIEGYYPTVALAWKRENGGEVEARMATYYWFMWLSYIPQGKLSPTAEIIHGGFR